ncbi:MAG TPA: glycosyltransferase [Candidatus Paceibacterota bacterium]|nr:glycosyltransferase [Candidatus Paceibacterota bacterium]
MAEEKNILDPAKKAANVLDAVMSGDVEVDGGDEGLEIVDERIKERMIQEKEKRAEAVSLSPQVESQELPEGDTPTLLKAKVARKESPVLEYVSERNSARILFLTKDTTVLQEQSPAFRRIADLRHTFAEVHIVLLNTRGHEERPPVLRFFNNVWLYATESTSWWKIVFDARRLVEQQLSFGGGFRADAIIAEDPFESGLVACMIGKKYKRFVQLHIYDDVFDESYMSHMEYPTLYTWVMHYVFNNVSSVRTKTEFQRGGVIAFNSKLSADAELLPSYYNLSAWRDFVPTFSLRERYPQFKFIIVHISSMQKSSHTGEVLLGVSPLLRRYPTIGLVIVGSGPLRSAYEKQAIALNLHNQIKFEPTPNEILSHLKSAHVLVHLSEDGAEDEVVLSAAVNKIPLVANGQGIAGKLFVDGESARLCDPTDTACVTDSVNMYLNDNLARNQFSLVAYDTVFERIEQDYTGYLRAYRASIERSIAQHTPEA